MHKKFGTVMDEKLLDDAHAFCGHSHISLSRLLEEAVAEYLRKKQTIPSSSYSVEGSFGILKVPAKLLTEILKEDIYDAV